MFIGIFIGSVGSSADLEGQVQQAVDAENDGFDSFWSAQVAGIDALTLFALAGQKTKRIQMGTAVVPTFPLPGSSSRSFPSKAFFGRLVQPATLPV